MNTTTYDLDEVFKNIKGKVYKNFSLGKKLTFFKTGGTADYLFIPESVKDLEYFLQNKPVNTKIAIIGLGSNLLVRDGGFKGVVIKLNNLNHITIKGNTLTAGAMALDRGVAVAAKNSGIGGLEFLYTIPGSIGGGIAMNAGAYGKEFKDIFKEAKAIDVKGNIIYLNKSNLIFNYRNTKALGYENIIFLEASFCGENKDAAEIYTLMQTQELQRIKSQPPANSKTGGSTFKNPPNKKAWELIKEVGGENLYVNAAKVSAKHSNFLENTGEATAKDIEDLGELIKAKVKAKFGVELMWEIKIIGEK